MKFETWLFLSVFFIWIMVSCLIFPPSYPPLVAAIVFINLAISVHFRNDEEEKPRNSWLWETEQLSALPSLLHLIVGFDMAEVADVCLPSLTSASNRITRITKWPRDYLRRTRSTGGTFWPPWTVSSGTSKILIRWLPGMFYHIAVSGQVPLWRCHYAIMYPSTTRLTECHLLWNKSLDSSYLYLPALSLTEPARALHLFSI